MRQDPYRLYDPREYRSPQDHVQWGLDFAAVVLLLALGWVLGLLTAVAALGGWI